jgi:hypothetical protein
MGRFVRWMRVANPFLWGALAVLAVLDHQALIAALTGCVAGMTSIIAVGRRG